jgi:hypothetical protein
MVRLVQVHERWALVPLRDLSDLVSSLNPNSPSVTLTVLWPDKVASFETSACLIIPALLLYLCLLCFFLDALYSSPCLLVVPYSLCSDLFLLREMQWTFMCRERVGTRRRDSAVQKAVWGESLRQGFDRR